MSKSSILGPQLAVWKPKKSHIKHPAMPYTPKKSETPQVGKLIKKSDCTDSMGKKKPAAGSIEQRAKNNKEYFRKHRVNLK